MQNIYSLVSGLWRMLGRLKFAAGEDDVGEENAHRTSGITYFTTNIFFLWMSNGFICLQL